MKSPHGRFLLLLAATTLAVLSGLAAISRGVISDPSLTLVLLLAAAGLGLELPPFKLPRPPPWLVVVIGLVGLGLYGSALGFLPFDLYSLGYHPETLLLGIVATLMLLWFHSRKLAAMGCASLLLAAWPAVHESPNLWDRILDPLLWGLMLIAALRRPRAASVSR